MNSRPSYIVGFVTMLICSALLTMTSCSGLRVPQPLKVDVNDWPMFGKLQSRTGFTAEAILPPLTAVWSYDVTGGFGPGSPLVVDSILFVGNLRGELHAVNTRTGKRIGWVNLGDAINGSPAISGNLAIVSLSNSDPSLIAFDLIDGKPLWKKSLGDIEASPLVSGDRVFVGNTDGVFYCVERGTGDEVWKFKLLENTKRKGIRSSAAVGGTAVVFGAEDGAVYARRADDGHELWSCATGDVIIAPPCVSEETVFVGNLDGTFSAIDLGTGVVKWRFNTGAPIYANAAAAHGSVFIGSTAGIMYALDAATGKQQWSTDLQGVINSGAVVSGNMLYVGTLKKTLFGLSCQDGTILVTQELQGRIKTSPAIADSLLFVCTDDKLVQAFKGVRP